MFDLYVSFIELALVVAVCRTKLFALKKQGHLSPPQKWCGTKKAMFSLRTACVELAKYNKVDEPSDEAVKLLGSKIVELRIQRLAK